MKRNLHPRTLLLGGVEEVGVDAAQDGLMGDNDDILTALEFHDNGFQADNNIAVGLSSSVAVVILVFITGSKVFRVLLGDILVSKTVANTRVEFVQSLPFQPLEACFSCEVASSLDRTLECRCPNDDLGIGWKSGLFHEIREGFRVSLASLRNARIPANFPHQVVLRFTVLKREKSVCVSHCISML